MFCTMFVGMTFLGLPFKNPTGSQNLDTVFDQISTLSQARPATHSAISFGNLQIWQFLWTGL